MLVVIANESVESPDVNAVIITSVRKGLGLRNLRTGPVLKQRYARCCYRSYGLHGSKHQCEDLRPLQVLLVG